MPTARAEGWSKSLVTPKGAGGIDRFPQCQSACAVAETLVLVLQALLELVLLQKPGGEPGRFLRQQGHQ